MRLAGLPGRTSTLLRIGTAKGRLRRLAEPLLNPGRRVRFVGSAEYWETRYDAGGTSGAGSYGDLARFKAGYLNEFVAAHGIARVIEFGCGDGHQLSLADYPSYIGLDVAAGAVRCCSTAFLADETKSFLLYDPTAFADRARALHADLAISLDVVFHLVEDEVFEPYMRHLFHSADRYVVVYSSDSELPDPEPHVRHRRFTPWVEAHLPDWTLLKVTSNPSRGTNPSAVSDFFVFGRRGAEQSAQVEA